MSLNLLLVLRLGLRREQKSGVEVFLEKHLLMVF